MIIHRLTGAISAIQQDFEIYEKNDDDDDDIKNAVAILLNNFCHASSCLTHKILKFYRSDDDTYIQIELHCHANCIFFLLVATVILLFLVLLFCRLVNDGNKNSRVSLICFQFMRLSNSYNDE